MAVDSSSKPLSSLSKGKSRATDFDDLNPTITYRQLHSHNLGVKDPLRVVALCDSDAFYAACEQIRLGIDPSRPLVVQQWDSLIAVNYPARKFGITRMEKIKEARRKCPELMVVHVATFKEGEKEPGYWENPDTLTHKVSLDHYRRESMKIIRMFQEGLPSGEIGPVALTLYIAASLMFLVDPYAEKASIDEAFIDFTRPVREELLRRYPYLAEVPSDAPDGVDSPLPPPPPISWDGLGTVISTEPLSSSSSDKADDSSQEVVDDNSYTTWHDVALSVAAEFMSKIRHDIHMELGYTTSAGIARNKFLAKLTASYKKPNDQSILRNAAIPNYLRPTPFQKIRFLGGKLGKAIAEEYDASTVGDLLTISLEEMQRKFGEDSIWVYEVLRGIDRSEVKEKSAVNKSMMASKNLPQPVTRVAQGNHWIRVLAAELALRLKEARTEIPALWPKTLVLHIRQGYETARSKQAPFPFTHDPSVDVVASAGEKLWRELVGTDNSRATPMKITNVALGFTGVEHMESGQRRIEGFFKGPFAEVDEASPGASVKRKLSEIEDDVEDSLRAGNQSKASRVALPRDSQISFFCDRCGRRVALPDDTIQDAIRGEALTILRVEHSDFHLAQDLERQLSPTGTQRFRPTDKPQARKKQQSSEGIAKFFGKK